MKDIILKCGCRFRYHEVGEVWELMEACLDDYEKIDEITDISPLSYKTEV